MGFEESIEPETSECKRQPMYAVEFIGCMLQPTHSRCEFVGPCALRLGDVPLLTWAPVYCASRIRWAGRPQGLFTQSFVPNSFPKRSRPEVVCRPPLSLHSCITAANDPDLSYFTPSCTHSASSHSSGVVQHLSVR